MTIINTKPGEQLAAQRINETDAGRALQTSANESQWVPSLLTEQQAQTQTQTTTASNGGLKIEHNLSAPLMSNLIKNKVKELQQEVKEEKKNILPMLLLGLGLYLILKK